MSQNNQTNFLLENMQNSETNVLIDSLEKTFKACLDTVKKKNADYSGKSVDPFKNFKNSIVVGVSPEKAILVRLMDKMSRISSLIENNPEVKEEAITDTIDDAINYFAILKAYIQNGKE